MTILLKTKLLVPHLPEIHIKRSGLVSSIEASLNDKVVIVTAPPGYGKTTLMGEVVSEISYPVVWYQLDEGDNDPATFMAYLLEGLHRQLPEVAAGVRDLLYSGESIPAVQLLVLLINALLDNQQGWLLILDDYQVITNPAVHQLTTSLVENRPECLQMMLSSRVMPPLPLPRWRARNLLMEIRSDKLRFSADEAQTWIQHAMPTLTDDTSQALANKTEGWGAGLQLAISLLNEQQADEIEPLVEQLGGTHPYIFHYLMQEVFEKQPQPIQKFLLRTSLCHQLSADICEQVLGFENAAQILDTIQRENLFLTTLDDQWYRYHQLFQEFLQDRLHRKHGAIAKALNEKLGRYYVDANLPEVALQYFLRINDKIAATNALRQFAFAYIEQGRVDILAHYLAQLGHIEHDSLLMMVAGYVMRHQGKLTEATLRFEEAHRHAIAQDNPTIATEALTQLASIARSRGDYQQAQALARETESVRQRAAPHVRALALMEQAKCEGFLQGMALGHHIAQQALDDMQDAQTQLSPYQQAQLHHSVGQICWWYGDVAAAIHQCEIAQTFLPHNMTPQSALIDITLALPYLYQHNYQKALHHAEQAVNICQELGLQEHLPTALSVLGNVLTRIGHLSQAESCLRQAITIAEDLRGARYAHVMAGGYLAYNLEAQDRTDEAQHIAQTVLFPHLGQTIVYEIYVCQSVLADTYLNDNQLDDAERIFAHLIDMGEARQYRIPLAMAYFGMAYIYLNQQHDKGMVYAQKSLDLIQPTGAWELYVDQGTRATLICNRLLEQHPHNAFLKRVLTELSNSPDCHITVRSSLIDVQTFGNFRVWRDGDELNPKVWVSNKARDLLAYFITFRLDRIAPERVLDAVWENRDNPQMSAFHTALYRMRKALRSGDEKLKYVLLEAGNYRLDAAKFSIDAHEFESLITQADYSTDYNLYEKAVQLYTGRYLANLYYDWAIRESERLSLLYVHALKQLKEQAVLQGDFERALSLAQAIVAENPFLEDIHRDIMRCHNQIGNPQGVVKQFQVLREIFRDELQADPTRESFQLYEQLVGLPWQRH